MEYDELIYKNKPDFYDAMRITANDAAYQSIPLFNGILLDFFDSRIRLTYSHSSLKLESTKPLTNEEALTLFQNFAVKTGKRVSYIANCPGNRLKNKNYAVMEKGKQREF